MELIYTTTKSEIYESEIEFSESTNENKNTCTNKIKELVMLKFDLQPKNSVDVVELNCAVGSDGIRRIVRCK